MNKFNAITIGLVVFVAVIVQLALATPRPGLLVNELDEDSDVDDQLEGGIRSNSKAKNKVGIEMADSHGVDVLDKYKNLPTFMPAKKAVCREAKHEDTCKVCCDGHHSGYTWRSLYLVIGTLGCTCQSRENSYELAGRA